MKKCELCRLPARLYCESDQASLCAGCDLKVHEANFLVARHSRTLLCKTCQSPTPWAACGSRLGNTVTECDKCVDGRMEEEGVVDEAAWSSDDEVFGEECDEEEADLAEEEGENQVAPWSSSSPPTASSSSGDASSSCSSSSACVRTTLPVKKRMRENDDVTDRPHKYLQISKF